MFRCFIKLFVLPSRSPAPEGDSDAPVSAPEGLVNFTSEARSFGVILNGSAGNTAGQDRLVIDPVQRPYGWSSEKAQQMAENLLHSYRCSVCYCLYTLLVCEQTVARVTVPPYHVPQIVLAMTNT